MNCVYLYVNLVKCAQGVGSSRTGTPGDCELPHVCWHLNLDPMQEQYTVLTIEPFVSPAYKMQL